jgi:heme A synthase
MTLERTNQRHAPKTYQGKKKQRWPTRILVALVSLGGMLGLWQFVAHEPTASARATPTIQDAEQQLQLNNSASNDGSSNFFSSSSAPNPNTLSGVS